MFVRQRGTARTAIGGLDDPAGKDIEAVREIRDEIETHVEALFDELTTEQQTAN